MAAYKPIRIGDEVPLQQINPFTETIDGKIQVTQTGVVLGRSSAGAGAHEEILFADLPGGGGGASYTEITYADMATAIAGGTLTPGGWYLIADAAGTDLGFLTYAVNENTISVSGVGGYLNADFQAVGDYSGVAAITGQSAGTQLGVWRAGMESGLISMFYGDLTGGAFIAGDTITGLDTGATATIVSDNGTDTITAILTSGAFSSYETIDNGGVQAVLFFQDAATISQGDIVIWDLLHWQLTDSGAIDGTDPATNVAAYTQLLKTDAGQGYITAWDNSEFDFKNNWLQYREDRNGNAYKYTFLQDANGQELEYSVISDFQFGNSNVYGNYINGAIVSEKNAIWSRFSNNTFSEGFILFGNNIYFSAILENRFWGNGELYGNTFTLSGINYNKCFGYFEFTETTFFRGFFIGNELYHDASVSDCTISDRAEIASNTFSIFSAVSAISAKTFTVIRNNILENGAQLTGITAGANCSISRNKIGQGATLGGSTTMGDGAAFNDLDIRANKQISNKTLDAAVTFSDKIVQLTTDAAETYSANVDGNRVQPGFSDIPGTIDITGLTTLDCTAAWAQYRGIFNLTSTNATEAIDTITNPPTLFPFTLRPAAGLVLTITGTAYAGIAAGQIALKAASYALDGDKGEYIVLEIDPLGTGALIEKAVINGLI